MPNGVNNHSDRMNLIFNKPVFSTKAFCCLHIKSILIKIHCYAWKIYFKKSEYAQFDNRSAYPRLKTASHQAAILLANWIYKR